MADMNEIVRMAVDAYHGTPTKYSVSESMDTLRQAMVAANNGSTMLNYKDIRDGKCVGLFALVEEILSRTIVEGFQGNEYFKALVDFRNVALCDKNLFEVEDGDLFVVSDAADGTQGIRRQRLGGMTETSIPTTFKVVRIYEELNRVLSGQVDFNRFIQKVSESFQKKTLDDIYSLWISATADDFGGNTYFPAAGAYDEDTLLDLIGQRREQERPVQLWVLRQVLWYSGCRDSSAAQGELHRLHLSRRYPDRCRHGREAHQVCL